MNPASVVLLAAGLAWPHIGQFALGVVLLCAGVAWCGRFAGQVVPR
jgi:hypothetical protein